MDEKPRNKETIIMRMMAEHIIRRYCAALSRNLTFARIAIILATFVFITTITVECHAFSFEDARALQKLLRQGKYDRVEAIIDRAEKAYRKDYRKEHEAYLTWKSFGFCQKDLERYFNAWAAAKPQSPYAYLARGIYYSDMGWALRGGRWARETSEQQFAEMHAYLAKAHGDVLKALELDQSIVQGYIELIYIIMGEGGDAEPIVEKALHINPYSLYIHSAYLKVLLPRWSGSMVEMEAFISTMRPYYGKNPRLRTLEGRLYIEKGDQYYFRRQYAEALKYYDKALSFGDSSMAYMKRGSTLFSLKKYAEAVTSFDKALKIDPLLDIVLVKRGESHYFLRHLDKALMDAQAAIELNPFDAEAVNLRGMSFEAQGAYEEALRDYQRATELDPRFSGYRQNAEMARIKISMKKRK